MCWNMSLKHVIETSDYPAIRQPPCCILFALHDQISRMVKEMLDDNTGIFRPIGQPCGDGSKERQHAL